jgi:hypothetical protein
VEGVSGSPVNLVGVRSCSSFTFICVLDIFVNRCGDAKKTKFFALLNFSNRFPYCSLKNVQNLSVAEKRLLSPPGNKSMYIYGIIQELFD